MLIPLHDLQPISGAHCMGGLGFLGWVGIEGCSNLTCTLFGRIAAGHHWDCFDTETITSSRCMCPHQGGSISYYNSSYMIVSRDGNNIYCPKCVEQCPIEL